MLKITLPLPAPELSPNFHRHKHWGSRAKKTKKARSDAYYAALDAIARQKPEGLPWEQATVQATFYFRDRRVRDADNLDASLKAARDGIADAGIVLNDSRFAPLEPKIEVDRADPRVVIEVKPLGKSGMVQ